MDESFSAAGAKFPDGQPSDAWTVEELLHWSLDQYQNKAIEQTAQHVASLREQCDKECEDVMTLHKTAVEMAKSGKTVGSEEENLNPQSLDPEEEGDAKPAAAAGGASAGAKAASSVEVQLTVGPHAGSKYLLRPRPGAPCLLGRSKGKKFVRNGVSLHKDQEVSTTHGKFLAEAGEEGGMAFYFVDVGSTNGTTCGGEALEPNKRVALEDGMELRLGNSAFTVVLG